MKNMIQLSTLGLALSGTGIALAQETPVTSSPAEAAPETATAPPVASTAPVAPSPAPVATTTPVAPSPAPVANPNPAPLMTPASAVSPSPTETTPTPAPVADGGSTSDHEAAHEGFFLGAYLGAAYSAMNIEGPEGYDISMRGAGPSIGLGIGGALAKNLIVQLEFNLSAASDPEISYMGSTVQAEDASVNVFGIGPSVTYYIMPANVSLGAALLASKASITQDGDKLAESDMGVGGALRVGKEWLVGRTGLGLSGQYQFASTKDKNGSGDIDAHAFGLNFTVNVN